MKQFLKIWCLLCLGGLLLVGGFGLLLVNHTPAYAQSEGDDEGEGSEAAATEEPTADKLSYISSEECESCHKTLAKDHQASAHGLALQDVERKKEAILADFTQSEDLRQVTFPNETTPRAFTADDIKYVIGVGRYAQAYLYEVDNHVYRLFPAEWNVQKGAWQPYKPADSWEDPAYDFGQNCAYCHVTGFDAEKVRWEEDGVQCEACHGPGSLHNEKVDDFGRSAEGEELVEIRAAINIGIDPQVCGQCHSRGVASDGQSFPVGYLLGTALSNYTTLFTPDDPAHFWATGHAKQDNMQYNEWLSSAHSKSLTDLQQSDLKDDTCLTCHSADYVYTEGLIAAVKEEEREGEAPASLTVDTAQFGVTCISCHNPHVNPEEALPANLRQEPYPLCISCHSNTAIAEGIHHPNQEMYEGTSVVEGVEGVPGVHFIAEGGPNCLNCHATGVSVDGTTQASHALHPIMPGLVLDTPEVIDTCSECHANHTTPVAMQELIDDIQMDVQTRLDAARAAITGTTPTWVTQTLDFIEGDGSLGIHNYLYTDTLLDAVNAELGLIPVEP